MTPSHRQLKTLQWNYGHYQWFIQRNAAGQHFHSAPAPTGLKQSPEMHIKVSNQSIDGGDGSRFFHTHRTKAHHGVLHPLPLPPLPAVPAGTTHRSDRDRATRCLRNSPDNNIGCRNNATAAAAALGGPPQYWLDQLTIIATPIIILHNIRVSTGYGARGFGINSYRLIWPDRIVPLSTSAGMSRLYTLMVSSSPLAASSAA